MNNLERIALMRAEEQVSRRGSAILHNPDWRAAKKPESRTARQLKCVCGSCHTCKNREAMRRRRDAMPKKPDRRRGPSMLLGRKCSHVYDDGRPCGQGIADWNRSGLCVNHRRLLWDSINRVRVRVREAA